MSTSALGETRLVESRYTCMISIMADRLLKYLCISSETSRVSREAFTLDRVSWEDLKRVKNMSDCDVLILNLTPLGEARKTKAFDLDDLARVFDPESWADIIAASGFIFIIGDPCLPAVATRTLQDEAIDLMIRSEFGRGEPNQLSRYVNVVEDSRGTKVARVDPLARLFEVKKDNRPFDYRRVRQADRESSEEAYYRYLDSVSEWTYSIIGIQLAKPFVTALQARGIGRWKDSRIGITSYKTALSAKCEFIQEQGYHLGSLTLLPPSAGPVEEEDSFIFKDILGIPTSLPAPEWAKNFIVPGEAEAVRRLAEKRQELGKLQAQVLTDEASLESSRRWLRLLYDDGDSLDAIVKEAFESLGAAMEKKSPEKDDYRVRVAGHREGIMEVKGTHNPKFPVGTLRQLSHWMDDVFLKENIQVKGIFLGNAGRKDEPPKRGKLFEPNNESLALIKDMVILRSMDLFCLVLLNQLDLLDKALFWKGFFDCKGQFDASALWEKLPKEFKMLPLAAPKPK